jgi:hypothetical protein
MEETPEPKRKLAIKKKPCPQCGKPLATVTSSQCQHCDWGNGEEADQAHPAHRPADEVSTDGEGGEDIGNRAFLPSSLGGNAETVSGPKLPDVPFWKLLVAPFHYKTLVETLILWGTLLVLVSPLLISPTKIFTFAGTSPKGFEFVWHIFAGLFLLTFIGRAASLTGWFERRGKDEKFQEGVPFTHVIFMFLILIAISDAPLEFATRAARTEVIQNAPKAALQIGEELQSLGEKFVVAGKSGVFSQLVVINKAAGKVIEVVAKTVPWYLLVALGWVIMIRPIYISVAGAYEEWDPTLAVKAMFKLFLPYLLVMVYTLVIGFLFWQMALAGILAVGPSLGLETKATTLPQVEAQVRTVVGVGLGATLLTTFASLLPYPMFGVMLQKWGHKI